MIRISSKYFLIASSQLPSIVKHMLQHPFAIFTSSRGELTAQDNRVRLEELKRTLREMGYGFYDTYGGWDEENVNSGIKDFLTEDSIFVPGISELETSNLCEKYNQEAYLYGKNGKYQIKTPNGVVKLSGSVRSDFRQVTTENPSSIFTGFKKDPRKFKLEPKDKKH